MSNIVLIVHNVRSCHNVGSLIRTSEGLGVNAIYLTGYTPHPQYAGDPRLPHEAKKISKQINKTALGAEDFQTWYYEKNIFSVLKRLKKLGFRLAALEQAENSTSLPEFLPAGYIALIVGREVEGVEQKVLDNCDEILEIPMHGQKESYNVASAAAIALYHLKFAK